VNILYVSLSYLPSRRASSVQVMRMCNALAQRGHRVTLVAKEAVERVDDLHAFYGVPASFAIERVARPRWRGGGAVFAAGVARRVLAARGRVELVYCRDLVGAAIAAEAGLPVAFEAHGVSAARWQRALLRRLGGRASYVGTVAISAALVGALDEAGVLPRGKPVVVAHSAADRFGGAAPREAVGAPPRIGYVGNLYRGRGIELIVELARAMPAARFELVGGTEDDLARLRGERMPANVVMHGFVAPARLAALYGQFDVLLMPYPRSGVRGATEQLDTSRYCSPVKMFEYMGSGVPMIASDLPVLQEIVRHEHNALIAPADDLAAWRAAIDRLLGDRALRVRLAQQALEDLGEHTSDARAARVLAGLGFA
jgi:glycosyltransferase involved in cell wall biosynthesis